MESKEVPIFYFFLPERNLKYMASSNFYYFLVELLIWYDTTKFHGHWPSYREVTQKGGAESAPWALPDSKKPGLFRVKHNEILKTFKIDL